MSWPDPWTIVWDPRLVHMHWAHHTSKPVLDLTVDVNVRWDLMNEEVGGVGVGDWQVSVANNQCDWKLLLERSGLNVSWRYLGVTLVKWMVDVRWHYYQRIVPPQDSKGMLRETWEHSWGKQRSQPVSLDCIQKGPGRPITCSVSNKPFG